MGITPESREKVSAVSYHEELVAFAKSNYKFLGVVEKALAEYVTALELLFLFTFLAFAFLGS